MEDQERKITKEEIKACEKAWEEYPTHDGFLPEWGAFKAGFYAACRLYHTTQNEEETGKGN